jgi:hypothetical protein
VVLSQQPVVCVPFGQTPASSGSWHAPPPAVVTTQASFDAHVVPLHGAPPSGFTLVPHPSKHKNKSDDVFTRR